MKTHQAEKPRARFCWLCDFRLRGRYYVEMIVDRHPRILHKRCAKAIKDGHPERIVNKMDIKGALD